MATFLIDNSIWQKAARSTSIAMRLRALAPRHLVITCPPQVLEYCHSARGPAEYVQLRTDMGALLPASRHPSTRVLLDLQQRLWTRGLVRAAAAFDCLIAGYAVVNDATLLNCDQDFGHIEAATDGLLRQEYVAE